MVADINLALNIATILSTMAQRVGVGRWWRFVYVPMLYLFALLWCLLFVAERSGNTYMRYKRGFRWNQPDTTYSAALALAYASNTLIYAIAATSVALKLAVINGSNKQLDCEADFKPCGKVSYRDLFSRRTTVC